MKVTVYTHPEFERKFKQYKKKYHSLVSDYRACLGQGLRKVRHRVNCLEVARLLEQVVKADG